MSKERYIKVYEWIVQSPELLLREAILICYVLSYPDGCHESLSHIAKRLNTDRKIIRRMLYGDRRGERLKEGLIKRGWLTYLSTGKQSRILYATPKYPGPGPLFEQTQRQEKNRQKQLQSQVCNLTSALAANWSKKENEK